MLMFNGPGPRPMPPRWLLLLLSPWVLLGVPVLLAILGLIGLAYGNIASIPPDRICTALGRGEGCTWTVARRLRFRLAVVVTDGGQSGYVLSRGRTIIGAGPLPSDFGPVAENDLLALGQLATRAHYVMGSQDLQAAILAAADLSSGVAYVEDLYALRLGNGTASSLGTALSGKLVVAVAQ